MNFGSCRVALAMNSLSQRGLCKILPRLNRVGVSWTCGGCAYLTLVIAVWVGPVLNGLVRAILRKIARQGTRKALHQILCPVSLAVRTLGP